MANMTFSQADLLYLMKNIDIIREKNSDVSKRLSPYQITSNKTNKETTTISNIKMREK